MSPVPLLKKAQIFGPLFEPCSSCVAVDSFFQKNDDLWEKQTPQRVMFRTFLSKCPNVDFFFGGGPAEGLAKKLRNAPSEGLSS